MEDVPTDPARIALLIDEKTDRREVILAVATATEDVFIARSIPAFVYGLALDDHFRLLNPERGEFELVKRSRELTVRAYLRGVLDRPEVKDLIDELTQKGGRYEVARNSSDSTGTSLLLLSANVDIGFAALESLLSRLPPDACEWEYGNVYDRDGVPLNWWNEN
nr:DUF4265 domain-containing protein [Massilia sp. PDC64]